MGIDYDTCEHCHSIFPLEEDYHTFELEEHGLGSILTCAQCKVEFAMKYLVPVENGEVSIVIREDLRDREGKVFRSTERKIPLPKKDIAPVLEPGEQLFIASRRGESVEYRICVAPDSIRRDFYRAYLDSINEAWLPRKACFHHLIEERDKESYRAQHRRRCYEEALQKWKEKKEKEKEKRKAEEEPSTTEPSPAKAQRQ